MYTYGALFRQWRIETDTVVDSLVLEIWGSIREEWRNARINHC